MATNANQETQNKSTRASAPELSVEPIQPAVSTSSVRLKKRSTPRPEPLPPSPADSARPDEDAVDDDNHSDSNLLAQQHNIQVVVRVRPFSKSEIASGTPLAWEWKGNSIRQITSTAAASLDKSSTSLLAPAAVPWSPMASNSSGNSSSTNGNLFNRPGSRRHSSSSNNILGQHKRFTFDHLFVPGDSTAKLYRGAVRRVVVSAAAGYHGSVCAYGQTATGKTYTMAGTNRHPGLMPLAVSELFAHVNATPGREFLLRCSYLELYNENLRDLLVGASVDNPSGDLNGNSNKHNNRSNHNSSGGGGTLPSRPGTSKNFVHHGKMSSSNHDSSLENSCNYSTHSISSSSSHFGNYYGGKKQHSYPTAGSTPAPPPLKLMDDCESGVIVSGLREVVVCSPQQAFALIGAGEHARQVGATDANAQSSRSHTLFRITVESRAKGPNAKLEGVRVSTLQLVDLAGSESAKATAATNGTRQREGACINKSLLALGKVVRLLSDQSKHRSNSNGTAYAYSSSSPHHIPFRESKLTRLLQPSLGGNAQVCLVCTLTPSVNCVDESLSTLAFASRAKLVQQTPTLNEAPPDQATLIERYRLEIECLKEQLASAQVPSSQAAALPTAGTAMVSPRLVQRLNDAQSLSSTQPQSTPTKDSSSRHHRSPLAPLQSHHLHEEQVAKSTPEAKRSLNLDSSYYDQEGEGEGHNRPGSSNSKHWEKDNDLIDTDLDDSWLEQLGSNSGGGRRRYEHGSGLFDLGFRELDGRDLDGRGTPRAQAGALKLAIRQLESLILSSSTSTLSASGASALGYDEPLHRLHQCDNSNNSRSRLLGNNDGKSSGSRSEASGDQVRSPLSSQKEEQPHQQQGASSTRTSSSLSNQHKSYGSHLSTCFEPTANHNTSSQAPVQDAFKSSSRDAMAAPASSIIDANAEQHSHQSSLLSGIRSNQDLGTATTKTFDPEVEEDILEEEGGKSRGRRGGRWASSVAAFTKRPLPFFNRQNNSNSTRIESSQATSKHAPFKKTISSEDVDKGHSGRNRRGRRGRSLPTIRRTRAPLATGPNAHESNHRGSKTIVARPVSSSNSSGSSSSSTSSKRKSGPALRRSSTARMRSASLPSNRYSNNSNKNKPTIPPQPLPRAGTAPLEESAAATACAATSIASIMPESLETKQQSAARPPSSFLPLLSVDSDNTFSGRMRNIIGSRAAAPSRHRQFFSEDGEAISPLPPGSHASPPTLWESSPNLTATWVEESTNLPTNGSASHPPNPDILHGMNGPPSHSTWSPVPSPRKDADLNALLLELRSPPSPDDLPSFMVGGIEGNGGGAGGNGHMYGQWPMRPRQPAPPTPIASLHEDFDDAAVFMSPEQQLLLQRLNSNDNGDTTPKRMRQPGDNDGHGPGTPDSAPSTPLSNDGHDDDFNVDEDNNLRVVEAAKNSLFTQSLNRNKPSNVPRSSSDETAGAPAESVSVIASGAPLMHHHSQEPEPNGLLPPSNLDIYSSGIKQTTNTSEVSTNSKDQGAKDTFLDGKNSLDDLKAVPREGALSPPPLLPAPQQQLPTPQVGATSLSAALKLAQVSPARQAVALDFAKAVVLVPAPMHFTTTTSADDTAVAASASDVGGGRNGEKGSSIFHKGVWRRFTPEELKKCAFVDMVPITEANANTALYCHLGLDLLDPQLTEASALARASPGCATIAKYYCCSSSDSTTNGTGAEGVDTASASSSSSREGDVQQQPRRRVRRFFGLGKNGDKRGSRAASDSASNAPPATSSAPVAVHLLHVRMADPVQENCSSTRNILDLRRELLADTLQAVLASFVASGLRVLRLPAHRLFIEACGAASDQGPRLWWEALQLAFAQLSLSERARAAARRVELCVVDDDDDNNDLLLCNILKDLATVGFTLSDTVRATMAVTAAANDEAISLSCTEEHAGTGTAYAIVNHVAAADRVEIQQEEAVITNHQAAYLHPEAMLEAVSSSSLFAASSISSPPVKGTLHTENTAPVQEKAAELSQVKEESEGEEEEDDEEAELPLPHQQWSFDGEEVLQAELQKGELQRVELHSPLLVERTQSSYLNSNSQNEGRNASWAAAPISSNTSAGASFLHASIMSPFQEAASLEREIRHISNPNMRPLSGEDNRSAAKPPSANSVASSHPNNGSVAGSAIYNESGVGEGSDREAMVEELVRVRGTLRRVLSSLKVSVRGSVSKSSSSTNAPVSRKNRAKGHENKPPSSSASTTASAASVANPNNHHEEEKSLPSVKEQGEMRSSALDVSSPPHQTPLPPPPQKEQHHQQEDLRAENERLSKALAARDEELIRRKRLADLQNCLHDLNTKLPNYSSANHRASWENEPETF